MSSILLVLVLAVFRSFLNPAVRRRIIMATKTAKKVQVISAGCLRHHELRGAKAKPIAIPRGMLLLTGPPNLKRSLTV